MSANADQLIEELRERVAEEKLRRLGTWKVSTFKPISPRLCVGAPIVESLGGGPDDDVAVFRLPYGVFLKLASEVIEEGWQQGSDALLGVSSVDDRQIYVGRSALDTLGVTYSDRVVGFETPKGVLLRPKRELEAEISAAGGLDRDPGYIRRADR